VDPTLLSSLGNELITSAGTIPLAPPPFTTPGMDAISLSIMSQVPALEAPILSGLPEVKEEATKTAANIVAAAQQYLQTDAQLAADYERHQFDGTASCGGGGSGASPSTAAQATAAPSATANTAGQQADSMSQMMGIPMQMAQQAVQMPMQAMGALGQAPQGIMQGVQSAMQQVGQMTEGAGKDDEGADADQQPTPDQRDEQNKQPEQPGAAPGNHGAERAAEPASVPPEQAVPDSGSPAPSRRVDASDPINL
jgi:hypothetical protein